SPRDSGFFILPGVLETKVMSPRTLPKCSARIASSAIRYASTSELVFPFLFCRSISSGNSMSTTTRRLFKLGPTENSTRVIDGIQVHWFFIVLFAKVTPITRKINCAWWGQISGIPSEKIVTFNLTAVKGQHKLNYRQREVVVK